MSDDTLSADKVIDIFRDCFFEEGEDTDTVVPADGIMINVGFNPVKLEKHRETITAMLDELPDNFKMSGGGGWSFLEACHDRHGHQWTGMHQVMEQLFLLGEGIGLVHCLLPRSVWCVMPGGMPYYVVDL